MNRVDDSGCCDLDLFLEICMRAFEQDRKICDKSVLAAFTKSDVNKDSVLTIDEFSNAVRELEPKVSGLTLKRAFREALVRSSDGGNTLSAQGFACGLRACGLIYMPGPPLRKLSADQESKAGQVDIGNVGLVAESWPKLKPTVEKLWSELDEHELSDPLMKDMQAQISALEVLLEQSSGTAQSGFNGSSENVWQLYRRIGVAFMHQTNKAEMKGREISFSEGGIGTFTTRFPLFV
jgi:hypothetical protein